MNTYIHAHDHISNVPLHLTVKEASNEYQTQRKGPLVKLELSELEKQT